MCFPNSSYPSDWKEMEPNCSYSPGEVRPQAQRHHWHCATGKRRPRPWRADHRGIGQLQLSANGWLSRRCVGKSRQRGVQRLSHKPSKDSGWDGRELRGESSLGGSWWAWKHFTSASPYVLRTTSCLPPQTSTSGTEKTRLAPSVHPPQTSNAFWLAARQACHKAVIPGGTTMSWNV